jgi:protein-tyrosine phosphatase
MGDGAIATPDRHLRLPGTRNLRDVGGYPAGPGRRTRWRTLLRTDALDRLPAASQEALLETGIRCVIDLRWPHELTETPSVFERSDRVAYRSIPLLDDDPTPHLGLAGMYRHILDERTTELVEIVRMLLGPDGLPAVIGCAAGKDRTGVAIALLLSAVGVAPDVVVDDYTLSGRAFAVGGEDEHLDDWRLRPIWVECPPEYMQAMLDHLDHRHGGAAALLLRHGITPGELARLVDLLTEPSA